jgi:hypothetical protein
MENLDSNTSNNNFWQINSGVLSYLLMKGSSRLVLYILINIIVSTLITLTVLWLWERTHPTPKLPDVTPESNAPLTENLTAGTETQNATDLLTKDIHIIIRTVVGAGNLEAEYVEIINQSDGTVDLTGWQLMDEEGHTFTFPSLFLNKGGAVEVHSKTGENTVIELYWQAQNPIWGAGEIVKLLNADDEIMATYSIP